MRRISRPIGPEIGIQRSSIRVNDRIIRTGDTHIGLRIGAMSKHTFNAISVVHGQIEARNRAVAPSHHRHFLDSQVVE